MQTATVVSLDHRRERGRRVAAAVAARHSLAHESERRGRRRSGGRAWLNGVELGERRHAVAHLGESYD
jgi:hypothetical protein